VIQGSCLCGRFGFELQGKAQLINQCHCSTYRKVRGAAFGSFLHADGGTFRWTRGASDVQSYESSHGTFRSFCRHCGSSVPVLEDDDGPHVTIPAGALDLDPGVRPFIHIHTASKACWYDITDALPQFDDEPPPGFWSRFEVRRE